jgi:protocatechuate 3,4-dioxygenase beta subunit
MIRFPRSSLLSVSAVLLVSSVPVAGAQKCRPTPWDEIGPFYRPNAPLRARLGSGYVLSGTVRSAADCRPLPGARIEFWQAGTNGEYDDAHRGAIIADSQGRYRLETDFPAGYARRPPHIHILVDMRGFAGLITQHYPKSGTKSATFDLVLEPE